MAGPDDALTILLVEDSDDDAFIFERTLAKTGIKDFRLFTMTNGSAAVEFLRQALAGNDPASPRPAIVFLDLKLPQLSGFDVLSWIRAQNVSPLLHVIVLSGSDETRDKKLAFELGATDYFTKPISVNDLRRKLESVS